jgi:hypothetical protein
MNRLPESKENRKEMAVFCPEIFCILIDWLRRRPKYAAGTDRSRDTDRYDGYLALKLQHDGEVWLKARGCSMLPVFTPMEEVKVVPLPDSVSLGQVVVFNQGAKLTAHRIVGHCKDGIDWIAKGDTLAYFDAPLPDSAVIGAVESVRGWRGHRVLELDVSAARLSSNLACRLCGYGEQRPNMFISCLYLVVFWTLYPFRNWPAIQKRVTISDWHYKQ